MKKPAPEASSQPSPEFAAGFTDALDAGLPAAVSRFGQAGCPLPPLGRPSADDLQRLREAGDKLSQVLPLSEDEVEALVADFDTLRRGRPLPITPAKSIPGS